MKKNRTARALLMSTLSLLLCVSMLVGSTFAWFTDSVVSANNIIKSGNLDVELYYQLENQDTWTKVAADTNVFMKDALWEPGHTEVVKLKVVNEGTLALNYQLGVNVVSETGSVNVDGDPFELSDYIKFAVLDETVNGREQAVAEAEKKGATELKSGYNSAVTKLLPAPAENDKVVTLVVYMPTTVGNEANHAKDAVQPVINLGINLFATQVMHEEDSFDEKYDNVALVNSAAALQDAVNAGKNVVLSGNINMKDATITIPDNYTGILDLNGKTVSLVNADADKNDDGKFTSVDNTAAFVVKGNLTVYGAGTVAAEHTSTNMEWNALFAAFSVEGGELTLGEGVVVKNLGGTDMAYAVDVNTSLGESILNVNGATLYSSYVAVRVFNNHNTQKGIVNYNSGILSGESRDIWTQIMSAPAENAVVNVADGISYTTNAAGDRYYFETETIVADAASLQNALNEGGEINLIGDIALGNTAINVPTGVNAVLNLGEYTISGSNTDTATHNDMFLVKGKLTVNGGKIIMNHTGTNMGWNGCTNTFDITAGGVLNLNNTYVENKGGTDMNFAVHMNNWGEVTVNIVDSTLKATYMPVRVYNSGPDMNNVTIEGSTLESTGGNFCFWVHNYASADFGGKVYSGSSVAYDEAQVAARLNFDIFGNGNTFITGKTAPVRYGFNSSVLFDANGNVAS